MSDATDGSLSPTTTLTDEAGRTLICYIEQTLTVDEQTYWLLLPVDNPIEIFSWEDDGETLVDVEDDDVAALLPTAKAVLAELDLTLQHSAYTLTAAGELPEPEEDDCFTLEVDPEEGSDEPTEDTFQMLATFFYNDQQFTLCTPLDPLLFFAKCDRETAVLLSPEEFQTVQPYLEDQLFDSLD